MRKLNETQHWTMAEGEKILAEIYGVRHKKQDGVLLLTSARIAWSSGDLFQQNYPYQQIKAQRISAESSSKVQLQLILHSGSQVNFHFTGDSAREQRNQVKQRLQQLLPKFTLQANPELEAKTSLLNGDPSLYQLYKDLVVGGLITADQFWANRLAKQDTERGFEQEGGLPSAFLADVQAVSDGCNAVKYNVTVDVIRAIFRTYPSVKAKHAELVPAKMSETDFWGQFFQSQLFHRDTTTAAAKSSDLFSDCLAQEHKSMLEKQQTGAAKAVLNTTESPAADSLGEGYSIYSECREGVSSVPLVQRCNLHSSMVLEALYKESTPQPPETQEVGVASEAHLSLKYLQPSQQPLTAANTSMAAVAQELATWTPQQVVNTEAAHSAAGYLVPGGSLMPSGGYGGGGGGATLTPAQREQVFRHQAAVAELLRHFWACFPVLSPQLEEKVQQMGQCLQEYLDSRLPELTTSLGPEGEQTAGHLRTCITIALERYHTWQSRRKT